MQLAKRAYTIATPALLSSTALASAIYFTVTPVSPIGDCGTLNVSCSAAEQYMGTGNDGAPTSSRNQHTMTASNGFSTFERFPETSTGETDAPRLRDEDMPADAGQHTGVLGWTDTDAPQDTGAEGPKFVNAAFSPGRFGVYRPSYQSGDTGSALQFGSPLGNGIGFGGASGVSGGLGLTSGGSQWPLGTNEGNKLAPMGSPVTGSPVTNNGDDKPAESVQSGNGGEPSLGSPFMPAETPAGPTHGQGPASSQVHAVPEASTVSIVLGGMVAGLWVVGRRTQRRSRADVTTAERT